jgi:hypothetical protein
MKFRDKLNAKFQVKEKKVESKAKTLEEMFEDNLNVQIRIANGEQVESAASTETKKQYRSSWRDSKGNVSCKIGVLPLFVDDKGNSITYEGVSESDYKALLDDIMSAYKSGELSDEINDLKKRKEEADKKAAESRANPKPKKKKEEDRSDLE